MWDAAAFLGAGLEDVIELGTEFSGRPSISEYGNALLLKEVEASEFVDSVDVVSVRMGVEDRIDALDVGSKRLLAKVGRSVDEETLSLSLDPHGSAQALILRIRGSAD